MCSFPVSEQAVEELIAGQVEVLGHGGEDAGRRPQPHRVVPGYGDVVLASLLCGQPDMRPFLVGR